MRTAISFLPLLRPFIMIELVSLHATQYVSNPSSSVGPNTVHGSITSRQSGIGPCGTASKHSDRRSAAGKPASGSGCSRYKAQTGVSYHPCAIDICSRRFSGKFTYVKEMSLISTSSCRWSACLSFGASHSRWQWPMLRKETHIAPFAEELDGVGLDVLGDDVGVANGALDLNFAGVGHG